MTVLNANAPPADETTAVPAAHARTGDELLVALRSQPGGLSQVEAAARLKHYGRNALPESRPPGIIRVFLHQFISLLIYVLVRLERFTRRVAVFVGIAALLMAAVALSRGMPFEEIFLLTVALAVSATPEGLPVALTVALAIGMRHMARRHVIVRRLVAVHPVTWRHETGRHGR